MIYVCQDGKTPSGVATYGRAVLGVFPSACMLTLNGEREECVSMDRVRNHWIPCSRSHDVGFVAECLHNLVPSKGLVTLLPNTGDTAWDATRLMLNHLSLAQRSNVRILGIVHSDVETQYMLAERFFAIAPVWIGVSRRCADELRRRVAWKGVKVYELPYPISTDLTPIREASQEPLKIAYVGRFEEPQKRISRLASVLERLGASGTVFRATLAGDGPAMSDFSKRLQQMSHEVRHRTTLAGILDSDGVKSLWRTHDVCLLTSAYEGMPLTLLEAMSAGVCPVVMLVDSGLPDLLVDGVNARLVPQGDVDGMVAVLQELSEDREQLRRLGSAAQRTVQLQYSPATHFRKLESIIRDLWEHDPPDPGSITPGPTALAVESIIAKLRTSSRPVSVFGVGMFGRKLIDACFEEGVPVIALADSDPARNGWVYRGLVCREPMHLLGMEDCTIAIGSMQFAEEMEQMLEQLAAQKGLPKPSIASVQA